MQATHGPGSRGRGRCRLLGWLIGLAALSALIMAPAASAVPAPTEGYLALGDSLAFGFSSQQYHKGEGKGFVDPELFEHGYANDYLKSLQAKALKIDKEKAENKYPKLINDGCPGETSGSLIGKNATLIGTLNAFLKTKQEEHGLPPIKGASACAYQAGWNAFKKVGIGGPLHHPYPHSQLEDALNTIKEMKTLEKKPVTTISLDIGPNDELAVTTKVEGEAKAFAGGYFVAHKAELEAEGKTEAEEQYAKHKAKYDQEGKEAGEKYYAEHEAEVNKEGEEAAFAKCTKKAEAENEAESREPKEEPFFVEKRETCLFEHGEEFAKEAIEAKLKVKGEEAVAAKLAAYAGKAIEFKLGAVGEAKGAELLKEQILPVFLQLQSNILGTLTAIRAAGSLGLEGESGEKYINYPGKIIFQGQYNPDGKQFKQAFEGVVFVGGINAAFAPEKAAVVTKCSEKAEEENVKGGKAPKEEPFFKEKREACVKAFSPAYAIDSGRCGEHAEKLEKEEEAIEAGCIAAALQPGFNALQGIVNLLDHETVAAEGLKACYTDPQLRFNPGKSAIEAERLKKWTRMTNATQTETEPVFGLKKYNGPDIHPTAEGYNELAVEMVKEETKTCHTEGLPGF